MNKYRIIPLYLLLFASLGCSFLGLGAKTLSAPTAPVKAAPARTATPTPADTPEPALPTPADTLESTAPAGEATAPAAAGNDFDSFYQFASEIAAAIKDKNAAFFGEKALPSSWTCLGDETAGVCKGQPSDKQFSGIIFTQEWKTYTFYSQADYQGSWKAAFKDNFIYKLAAVASRAGDNPIMPAADQSFQAILTLSKQGVDTNRTPVHVLYFENVDGAWRLRGELVTTQSGDWLKGTCSTCYDHWKAWQN